MTTTPEPGQNLATPRDGGPNGAHRPDAGAVGYTVPIARPAKSRLLQDGRDMFWSLAPLVLACVVLAGLLGMCSFAPTGPGRGPAPDYDAPAALQADADALKIPIRVPKLPDGWQANSGSRRGIEAGRADPVTGQPVRAVASTVGYLTPSGMYLSLTQSNADEDKLIASLGPDRVPTGTQDVDGVRWIVYEGGESGGKPVEPVWTARLKGPTGPAQLALTGAAGTAEYRTLAAATQSQSPLAAK
ncbi:hypothetical protein Mycch_4061 [Mycolicibacterium chubuense NBB4]|uniref:DUF4245 domain-containing protein n=1 Tax=Mycolicibacterium chubuense (strain NBB4) TaxID=710421 RepID=I4BNC6_MYCCN|nr:DUF4245 domain-containing protein [Mycolicibacterium chubuense]AFM18783.1 hypothetical protein Mycch_4061 [Mycolicibacterium chubuense NBB4]